MNTSLDAYGILNGTDKSSLNHDYLRHYDMLSVIPKQASDFAGAPAAAKNASRLNPADNRLEAGVAALQPRI
jgi:hypothetical protein